MTTVIGFDLDGTLVQYDRGFGDIRDTVFEEHLGTATEEMAEAYEEVFFEAFDALEPEPYATAMAAAADQVDPAAASADDAALADPDVPAMVETLRDEEYAETSVAEATRDCLEELAADDETTLAVVTDGVGDWQREKLAHHDLAPLFDETVVSYAVGGHKVDGAPYDAIRERVAADEYVMVGDSYESDVEAAREAGFVPVQYEDEGADLFAILRAML